MLENYKNKMPKIHKSAKIFKSAAVIGDVNIKENVSIWYNSTVRGDMARVEIGKDTNIQDNVVIHTNTNLPTIIGKNVTIGHSAIVHACTIEDNVLIGMGSVILDGATIEEHALVGAGCLVPPNKVVPRGSLVVGNPMKIIRQLTNEEIEGIKDNKNHYIKLMNEYKK
ncbi:MAG: gamma carbonic anhydrase family protein [Candidatus Izimaplasma sp.]|nr:gamma carbonic anhydrase family protein [Candidatus Izimaplasma bacterium]